MLSAKQFDTEAIGPLAAIRVLDMSRLVAGNMLTLQLADFGADVLKIESIDDGDPLRDWLVNGHPLFWKIYCRNKKSAALNLRSEKGRGILLQLVRDADVLVENYRPGTLEKMQLSPALLLELNPRLVIVRASGYGQDGPYRDRPGYGTLIEGMSGFAARLGYEDRPPILPPLALADIVTGMNGAFATMVALHSRTAEGGGQVVDLSLMESVIPLLGPEAESYQQTGKVPKRHGSRSEIAAPRNVFGTADGRWVSLSAPMQSMAERLFRTIGREDMIDDPRFSSNQQRLKHADECEAAIAAFIAARPFDEVMRVFEQAQVTVAPVNEVDQMIRDPHIVARETLVTLPDEDLTTIAMHNVAPRLSGTPGSIRFAAPKHGEHTAQVLASLGFSDADIRDLDAQGVIRQHRGDRVADAVTNAVTNESGTHGDSDVGAKADTEANSAPAGTLASTPVGTRTR